MNEDIDSAIALLRVKEGDPITRKLWNGLLDLCTALVKSFSDFSSGTGVRLHRYPQGVNIVADRGTASFMGRFSVRIAGKDATVGAGTMEGVTPKINGTAIDGYDANGKLGTIPKLKINGGPGDNLRSYVCIQATIDVESGKWDPEMEDALTVVHVASLELEADLVATTGLLPLAMLIWSDTTTISRVRQIVYFDQKYRFIPSADGVAARHVFWPAS